MMHLRHLLLSASLLACGLSSAACANDACEDALFPEVELTLDIAPSVALDEAERLQLRVFAVINGAAVPLQPPPDSIAVAAVSFKEEKPTLRVTVSTIPGSSGASLPPGAQARLAVEILGAKLSGSEERKLLGSGDVTFDLARNACNFYTVRIEAPSGGADSGAGDDSASGDSAPGGDATPGSDAGAD
jgi:hypothetical protein